MTWRLRLYVTGQTSHARRAIQNLHDICERALNEPYEVEVIDVLEHPAAAEEDRILATPTLVRRTPEPVRKIIGDLSDRERVYSGLDLRAAVTTKEADGAQ